MLDLAGRNVLVTGASSGFGEATAVMFARKGAHVALTARTAAKLQAMARDWDRPDRRVLALPADAGDAAQLEAVHAAAVEQLGAVEILVNNAGMNVPARAIADTRLEEWDDIMAVNLKAAFRLTQLVMPAMKAARRGTIVNVASRAGNFPSLLSGVAYSSSKIGMRALNRVSNEEGNPFNIRCVLVNPGVGATPILDRRPEPPPPAERAEMLQAEDVAATILFAASLPSRACLEQINVYPTNPNVG